MRTKITIVLATIIPLFSSALQASELQSPPIRAYNAVTTLMNTVQHRDDAAIAQLDSAARKAMIAEQYEDEFNARRKKAQHKQRNSIMMGLFGSYFEKLGEIGKDPNKAPFLFIHCDKYAPELEALAQRASTAKPTEIHAIISRHTKEFAIIDLAAGLQQRAQNPRQQNTQHHNPLQELADRFVHRALYGFDRTEKQSE